mgnify:CR=1
MATTITKEEKPAGQSFVVRLDPQHPGGRYRRANITFLAGTDVVLSQVPDEIRADPWLMVAQVEVGKAPTFTAQQRREKQAGRRL